MNKIAAIIKEKSGNVLNVYFTAGFPALDSTTTIIKSLADSGADLIELGMPYSDPLADGTTIQQSSEVALKNGISLDRIFDQIEAARATTDIPIIMMGYYNQMLQYGPDRFLARVSKAQVQGLIIPDLPMDEYEARYQAQFEEAGIGISFLITPLTSEARIRQADRLSTAFVYMVSQTSITGSTGGISKAQLDYFDRIDGMALDTPRLIGFGIHDHTTYRIACDHSDGAIIGSAYIRALGGGNDVEEVTRDFVKMVKGLVG
jgi:tryptophan synthase alpha chain